MPSVGREEPSFWGWGSPYHPHLSLWSLTSSAPAFSLPSCLASLASSALAASLFFSFSPSARLGFGSSLGASSLSTFFSPSCPSASLVCLGESWVGGAQLRPALDPPLPTSPTFPYLQSIFRFPLDPGFLILLLGLLIDHQLPLLIAATLCVALLLPVTLWLPFRLGILGAGLLLGRLERTWGTHGGEREGEGGIWRGT